MSTFSVEDEEPNSLESLRMSGLSPQAGLLYMSGFVSKFWSSPKIVRWTYAFMVAQVVFAAYKVDLHWQWFLVLGYLFNSRTPFLSRADKRRPGIFFFLGETAERVPIWLLTLSTATCWVSAWDVQQSVQAGAAFGLVGGAASAAKYATLPVVATVVAALRSKAFPGASGLTDVIQQRFGTLAALLFQAVVIYRLFTFVWANASAVADFYAPVDNRHNAPWWVAALLAILVPLLYTQRGGFRAALYADGLLGFITAAGIFAVAAHTVAESRKRVGGVPAFVSAHNTWSLQGGGDALLVSALEAVSSFGFMDPVLTDRAFVATPERMVVAFSAASLLGALKVFALCFVGIHFAGSGAAAAGQTVDARLMGKGLSLIAFQVLTLVLLSSGVSALAATFASAGKLWSLELSRLARGASPARPEGVQASAVWSARSGAALCALLAALPLLATNVRLGSLRATFATGTPVLGLGWPIFYAAFGGQRRRNAASPFVFLLPLACSIALGLALQISTTSGQDTISAPDLIAVDHQLLPRVFVLGAGAGRQRLAWTLLTLAASLLLCAAAAVAEAVVARRQPPGEEGAPQLATEYDAEQGGTTVNGETKRLSLTGRLSAGSRYNLSDEGSGHGEAPARPQDDDELESHAAAAVSVSRRSLLGGVAGVRFSRSDNNGKGDRTSLTSSVDESAEQEDSLDLVAGIQARVSHSISRIAARISGSYGQEPYRAAEQPAASGEEPQEEIDAAAITPTGLRGRKSQGGYNMSEATD